MDNDGRPTSLAPNEVRFAGPKFFWVLMALLALIAVTIAVITFATLGNGSGVQG